MTRGLVAPKVADEHIVAERHSHLVSAATELFLHQGFHKTSVREIARAAGWNSMGTLYLYINQKEDVLFLISEAIMADLWDGLSKVPRDGSARRSLEDSARYFFQAVERKRREVKLLYRESASLKPEHLDALKDSERKEVELFASILRRGIEAHEFREVDSELFAHDIIMLAHMWPLKGWALYPKLDFQTYVDRQVDLILSRLLP